ncbi:hypothetical protein NKH77_48960 [Streptomyces sp. M19]
MADEAEGGVLPDGEWWVLDSVEGTSTTSTAWTTGAPPRPWCATTSPW